MSKICIFSGTSEGRRLIDCLSGRGLQMTACVATEYGEELAGTHSDVRVLRGRMDAAEMCAFMAGEAFDAVVDATHPYACAVTENIAAACAETGCEYLRLLRASGEESGDGIDFPDVQSCAAYLKGRPGNVLLTTGSKELAGFCAEDQLRERLFVRVLPMQASLEACARAGILPAHIIAMQGPFDEELNFALLRAVNAACLVTKDSGSVGGYPEKRAAARRAGAQLIVIGRPEQREGKSLEAVLDALSRRFSLPPMRKRVSVIGIGMGNLDCRTFGMERALHEAELVIGARRMLESVDVCGKQTVEAVAAEDIAEAIHCSACLRCAVVFSGDTGFYSGAKRLLPLLERDDVEVLPGIGSLQYFCARLHRSWEDVCAVSLHGRDCNIAAQVACHSAVFALVGGEDGARALLIRLEQAGFGNAAAFVGERLGYPGERISRGSVAELAQSSYDSLSVVLIENAQLKPPVVTHGLPDDAFERDRTPMTKSEVRSVSLSKLALTETAIVYDVGAGSGSISVEAALQARRGRVYAIEMKDTAVRLMERNRLRFHAANMEIIEGRAPEAMEKLPAPTHAFIGGSTGSLREIVDALVQKNPEVRIVVNTVTLETLAELTELSREFEFSELVEISASKAAPIGRYRLMMAENPVFVCTLAGRKKDEGREE